MLIVRRFIERHKSLSIFSFIIIIVLIFLIDSVYFGFILTLFTNETTGLVDKNLIWNAIGSISTSIAVLIALFQYSLQNRKRIQLSFDQATIVHQGIVGSKILVLSISNLGLKTVNIQSWRFIIQGKKHYMIFPTDSFERNIQLPLTVASEETKEMYFSFEPFLKLMTEHFNLKKKLKMYVVDSVGSRYYLTSNEIIEYYIQ